ncbi:MAG TPA: hypothetical protein VN282_11750 [Pyrinomonadaceae bacterium]|nr:hypothetical protein [Pyrinomonadaceae bacterium]
MKPSKAVRRVEPPRWPTVRCPGCLRSWLAAGVRGGDTYTCKACGRQFVVGKQEAAGKNSRPLGRHLEVPTAQGAHEAARPAEEEAAEEVKR